ncbi:MAG: DUF924 domain-containing protein [Gammaproteobacteria bacterium]|nr:DUF924 domain-containing protein [Gammaproteobacteria bacterium]
MESVHSLLSYWFGTSNNDADVIRDQSALWWKKNPEVDTEIRRRFEPLLAVEIRGALESWSAEPRGHLARILLCDQFPRNIYRGKPESFMYDARAKQLARVALDRGWDKPLRPVERVFVYLAFEHSEDAQDQSLSVELFSALYNVVAEELKQPFRYYLDFATKHKEIIDRFGRFPHRNAILGRLSTPEELEFLEGPGSSF